MDKNEGRQILEFTNKLTRETINIVLEEAAKKIDAGYVGLTAECDWEEGCYSGLEQAAEIVRDLKIGAE